MAQVPTGSTFFIASAFAAPRATTAVTNATEAVVTSAGHGYSNGDVLEVTSGWGRLNLRAVRIKGVTTDSFILENVDTTNTNFFPVGTGVGSVRKATAFTQITQVLSASSSGGDPKTVSFKYIESDVEFSLNDGFTATSQSLDLDADSIGSAGYAALKSLTDTQTNTILRTLTRSGSVMLQPCTVALNESVKLQDGQVNRVTCAFNGNSRLTRYAS
ncbi:MAG: phage tail protein [Proteobacteria bacterium]|nr:phage tail protein [Pseudomonadota bacterium]